MHFIKKIVMLGLIAFHLPVLAQINDNVIQEEILVHINQYRQQHGLSKLRMHPQMVKEAKQHSRNMANHKITFGHQGFMGRIKRLRAHITHAGAGAENVAYNYKDAKTVVREWLKSPGHKRNIDGQYDLTGIGIARDKQGKIYFTELFLRIENQATIKKYQRPWGVPFPTRRG